MAVLFQMVNNPAADDAVNIAKSLRGFAMAVSYDMEMIWHDDIGIDGKPCRLSRLVESVASDDFESVGTETGRRSLATAVR